MKHLCCNALMEMRRGIRETDSNQTQTERLDRMRTARSEPKERAAADVPVSLLALRLYTITARHTPGINQEKKRLLKQNPITML